MNNYYKGTLNGSFDSIFCSLGAFENIKSIEMALPEANLLWGIKIGSKLISGSKVGNFLSRGYSEMVTMVSTIIMQSKLKTDKIYFEIIISLKTKMFELYNPITNLLNSIIYTLKNKGKNIKYTETGKKEKIIGNVNILDRPEPWICPQCNCHNIFTNDICPQCYNRIQ